MGQQEEGAAAVARGFSKSPKVPETQVPRLQGTRIQGAPVFPIIKPDATPSCSHRVCLPTRTRSFGDILPRSRRTQILQPLLQVEAERVYASLLLRSSHGCRRPCALQSDILAGASRFTTGLRLWVCPGGVFPGCCALGGSEWTAGKRGRWHSLRELWTWAQEAVFTFALLTIAFKN